MAKKNQTTPVKPEDVKPGDESTAQETAPAVAAPKVEEKPKAQAKKADGTVTVYRMLDRLMPSAPDKDDGIEAGTKVRADTLSERGVLARMLSRGDVLEHVWTGPESQFTEALRQ